MLTPRQRDGLSDDLPVLLVWGNCQAEAVRAPLAASPSLQMRPVRIPPVFELTASDIDPLRRLVGRASVLLAQPVKDGYRDLPLGTAEVASLMPKGGTVVRWPVVRSSVLHPFQAIIRDPRDPTREPPVVPYHDLRTLASARTGKDLLAADIPIDAAPGSLRRRWPSCAGGKARVRRCHFGRSRTARARRHVHYRPSWEQCLIELARRLQVALDSVPDATDPGRDPLGEVRAPVSAAARPHSGWQEPHRPPGRCGASQ